MDLQDLFVSYKAIEPEKAYRMPSTEGVLDLRKGILSRAQQIAGMQTGEEDSEEPEEDYGTDWQSDLEGQPEEFQWFTTQLRTAWRDNAAPDGQKPSQQAGYTAPAFKFTGSVTKYNRGQLDKEIKALFDRAGINIRVTSGKRKPGAVGKAGNRSYHVHGNACDIVPGQGETFDSIRRKMKQHPEILQFFYENGLGVIDETIPENMKRTGATGPHFHIGPDQWATRTWAQWTGGYTPSQTGTVAGSDTKKQNWSTKAGSPTFSGTRKQKRAQWANAVFNAYYDALKNRWGRQYSDSHYKKIAAYMTYQSACESAFGEHANGYNYAGHRKNNKNLHYSTLDDFVNSHIYILRKWDYINANNLQDFVYSFYKGKYQYNPNGDPYGYYSAIKSTKNEIDGYLGAQYARYGGKFGHIRALHEKGLSKYR